MAITINGSTGIASVDGSAGSPSVRGTDANSGVYYASDEIHASTAGVSRALINSNGEMGLGVTPKSWKTGGDFRALQIGTGLAVIGRGSGDEDRGGISVNYYVNTSDTGKYIGSGHANYLYMNDGRYDFRTAASGSADGTISWSTPFSIKADGKVGIGIESPTTLLDIRGTAGGGETGVKIVNSANEYTALIMDANRTSADNALGIIDGRWNGNQNCAIYLTAGSDTTNKDDGGLQLQTRPSGGDIASRLRITGSGVWYSSLYSSNTNAGLSANVFVFEDGGMGRSSSSGKWKKNIETIQDSYADKILTMRPTWYQQDDTKVNIPQGQNKDWGYWGFIAEEVAAIDPRLVTWKVADYAPDPNNKTGAPIRTPLSEPEPDNVAYERFVPHLVNLIKRQDDRIKALETKVAALEAG